MIIILFDEKTVAEARNTDIIKFLERYSRFTFTSKSGAYRCRQHPSLAVKSDCLSWYWHSKGVGGFGAIDYLMKVENMRFRDAVEFVSPPCFTEYAQSPRNTPAECFMPPPKNLILPEKAGLNLQLFDYLCNKRGIDSTIVNKLIQERQLYEDKRRNIVFVGYDEQGKARFASLRGTYGDCTFRRDCTGSDKRYGFIMTASPSASTQPNSLYIFESAIDAMSHASLVNAQTGDKNAWLQHNRLSLAGTADMALVHYLNTHLHVKELIFCLDNDTAGQEATTNLMRKYTDNGYIVRTESPLGKDFNDDLLDYITKIPGLQHLLYP